MIISIRQKIITSARIRECGVGREVKERKEDKGGRGRKRKRRRERMRNSGRERQREGKVRDTHIYRA